LDTKVDWIPGLKNFRLKDFPETIKIKDPNNLLIKFVSEMTDKCQRASAVISRLTVSVYYPLIVSEELNSWKSKLKENIL